MISSQNFVHLFFSLLLLSLCVPETIAQAYYEDVLISTQKSITSDAPGVIDSQNGFAYFATSVFECMPGFIPSLCNQPDSILKLSLSSLSIVQNLTLPGHIVRASSLTIGDGILYFSASSGFDVLDATTVMVAVDLTTFSVATVVPQPLIESTFSEKSIIVGNNLFVPFVYKNFSSAFEGGMCGVLIPSCETSIALVKFNLPDLTINSTLNMLTAASTPSNPNFPQLVVEYLTNLTSGPVMVAASGDWIFSVSLTNLSIISQSKGPYLPGSCLPASLSHFPAWSGTPNPTFTVFLDCCVSTSNPVFYQPTFQVDRSGHIMSYSASGSTKTSMFMRSASNTNAPTIPPRPVPPGFIFLLTSNAFYSSFQFSIVQNYPSSGSSGQTGLGMSLSSTLFPTAFIDDPKMTFLVGKDLGTNGGFIMGFLSKCPPGTSVAFPALSGCDMCKAGFYSDDALLLDDTYSACTICPDSAYCPPGSISPIVPPPKYFSEIPPLKTIPIPQKFDSTPILFGMAGFVGVAALVGLLWECWLGNFGLKFKKILRSLDPYTLVHFTPMHRSPVKKQTWLGGFIWLIVLVSVTCITAWNLTTFLTANTQSATQILREVENQKITGATLNMNLSFFGMLPDACFRFSSNPISPITPIISPISAFNQDENANQTIGCNVQWTLPNSVLEKSGTVFFSFPDIRAYAGYVVFNVTVAGQYQGLAQSAFDINFASMVQPPEGMVLHGASPTTVSILFTRYEQLIDYTYLHSQTQPSSISIEPGSTSGAFDLSQNEGLFLNFVFNMDSTFIQNNLYHPMSVGSLFATIFAQVGAVFAAGQTVLALFETCSFHWQTRKFDKKPSDDMQQETEMSAYVSFDDQESNRPQQNSLKQTLIQSENDGERPSTASVAGGNQSEISTSEIGIFEINGNRAAKGSSGLLWNSQKI